MLPTSSPDPAPTRGAFAKNETIAERSPPFPASLDGLVYARLDNSILSVPRTGCKTGRVFRTERIARRRHPCGCRRSWRCTTMPPTTGVAASSDDIAPESRQNAGSITPGGIHGVSTLPVLSRHPLAPKGPAVCDSRVPGLTPPVNAITSEYRSHAGTLPMHGGLGCPGP